MESMDLEAMKNVDIKTVNPDELVNLEDVALDEAMPREERIKDFIRQIKNPYCFKCNGIVVKLVFTENGPTLDEVLAQYFEQQNLD